MHAIRDIAAGDGITIYYWRFPPVPRYSELEVVLHFECSCGLRMFPASEQEASLARRRKSKKLEITLENTSRVDTNAVEALDHCFLAISLLKQKFGADPGSMGGYILL